MPPTPTTLARSDDRVRAHLAARGFGGHIRLVTWPDPGEGTVTTEVRQSDGQSAPWTDHVANWLVAELKQLPGYLAVRRPVPGVIRVTWAGAR